MQLFLAFVLIAVPIAIAVLPSDTAQPQFFAEPINETQFSVEKPLPGPFFKMDGGGITMQCGTYFSLAFYV